MFHPATAAGVLVALAGALTAPSALADAAATAKAEYDQVMALTPDLEKGRQIYLTCSVCHRPEGWGTPDGAYPQIAGQLRTVIIKQLADIRARNRENPLMYPFSVPRILGGPQSIADVAAYVAQLPMTPDNGLGPGIDLALGKELYEEHCVKCHGEKGEGVVDEHGPAIAGQHYAYLVRQFDAIRSGLRRNSDPKMVKQIESFSPRQESAVLDYTSRLRPSEEKLARTGWTNPDFPGYIRDPSRLVPPPPQFPPMLEPPEPPLPPAPPGRY